MNPFKKGGNSFAELRRFPAQTQKYKNYSKKKDRKNRVWCVAYMQGWAFDTPRCNFKRSPRSPSLLENYIHLRKKSYSARLITLILCIKPRWKDFCRNIFFFPLFFCVFFDDTCETIDATTTHSSGLVAGLESVFRGFDLAAGEWCDGLVCKQELCEKKKFKGIGIDGIAMRFWFALESIFKQKIFQILKQGIRKRLKINFSKIILTFLLKFNFFFKLTQSCFI